MKNLRLFRWVVAITGPRRRLRAQGKEPSARIEHGAWGMEKGLWPAQGAEQVISDIR